MMTVSKQMPAFGWGHMVFNVLAQAERDMKSARAAATVLNWPLSDFAEFDAARIQLEFELVRLWKHEHRNCVELEMMMEEAYDLRAAARRAMVSRVSAIETAIVPMESA
jgi:hypothetical protein